MSGEGEEDADRTISFIVKTSTNPKLEMNNVKLSATVAELKAELATKMDEENDGSTTTLPETTNSEKSSNAFMILGESSSKNSERTRRNNTCTRSTKLLRPEGTFLYSKNTRIKRTKLRASRAMTWSEI